MQIFLAAIAIGLPWFFFARIYSIIRNWPFDKGDNKASRAQKDTKACTPLHARFLQLPNKEQTGDKKPSSSVTPPQDMPETPAIPQIPTTTPSTSVTITPQPSLQMEPMRIVVAMTGATGAILAIRTLTHLRALGVETHLVISRWAIETLKYETPISLKEIKSLATHTYNVNDAAATISSGSFRHDGMIVVPCSMRTLSAIRTGFADDLICRAADVTIKERRKLVLVVRETPLSVIHLDNMLELARMGVVIAPPMPAFYTRPESVDDIVEQSVGRLLDCFGLDSKSFRRWNGMEKKGTERMDGESVKEA